MSATRSAVESEHREEADHHLQCLEIIGGNHAVENTIASPGLDIWISSQPYEGHLGGDIHYFSACGSGRVTRLAVADVSGHGPETDGEAKALRKLMRKHINLLDQTNFARAVNRDFIEQGEGDSFATAMLITYFSPTDHLIVCNAGHPRPLWYSQRLEKWQLLDRSATDTGPSIREAEGTYMLKPVSNLPMGVIEPTDYYQFAVNLAPGDLVVIYTDGLIEAKNADEGFLGESGLLRMVEEIGPVEPEQLGKELLARVNSWREDGPAGDDQTLIVMRHNAVDPPPMTLGRAVKSLAKMVGLG